MMIRRIFLVLMLLVVVFMPGQAGAAVVTSGLLDYNSTQHDWSPYSAVMLQDWNAVWIGQVQQAGARAFVYKDLSSVRVDDCGTWAGGQPCIVNGVICPPGVNDAPFYAGGLGFCWTWRNHRDWFLRNMSGRLIQYAGYPGHYMMDFGNPWYQLQWLYVVAQDMRVHGWRYVFADNAISTLDYGTPAKYPTVASIQAATKSMLSFVGLGLRHLRLGIVANLGYTNLYPSLWRSWLPYVSGLMNEHNVGDVVTQQQDCVDLRKTCFFNVVGETFTVIN